MHGRVRPRWRQTPPSACGRIGKICQTALHGCVRDDAVHGEPEASRLVVETDLLVEARRDRQEAVTKLEEREEQAIISVVTPMALIVGCRKARAWRCLERLLTRCAVRNLPGAMARRGVSLLRQYRLSHGRLSAAALMAATALTDAIALMTKNQRDFRCIDGLELLPYPSPS